MSKKLFPQRGEIWLVEFPPAKESRKPIRPVLIISENIQNQLDEWIAVVPITTEDIKVIEPFEVYVKNIPQTGVASKEVMKQAQKAWKIAFVVEEW